MDASSGHILKELRGFSSKVFEWAYIAGIFFSFIGMLANKGDNRVTFAIIWGTCSIVVNLKYFFRIYMAQKYFIEKKVHNIDEEVL